MFNQILPVSSLTRVFSKSPAGQASTLSRLYPSRPGRPASPAGFGIPSSPSDSSSESESEVRDSDWPTVSRTAAEPSGTANLTRFVRAPAPDEEACESVRANVRALSGARDLSEDVRGGTPVVADAFEAV